MTELDALQASLAGEHAAVHLYGVLGGRAAPDTRFAELLAQAYREHRDHRDELTALVRALGGTPAVAAPGYALPGRLRSAAALRTAAVAAEEATAEGYAALVAAATGDTRSWAVAALTAAAVRRVRLGGPAQAFPGAPELG